MLKLLNNARDHAQKQELALKQAADTAGPIEAKTKQLEEEIAKLEREVAELKREALRNAQSKAQTPAPAQAQTSPHDVPKAGEKENLMADLEGLREAIQTHARESELLQAEEERKLDGLKVQIKDREKVIDTIHQ